jgi:hypothetical protein
MTPVSPEEAATLSVEELALRMLALFVKRSKNNHYSFGDFPLDATGKDGARLEDGEKSMYAIALNHLLTKEYVVIDYFSGAKSLVITDLGLSAIADL